MKVQRQDFLFVVTLAGAAVISALGQNAALAAAPADSVSIPDFSGRWGRNAFNFEPVEGGPKPVVNLARLPDGTSNIGRLVGDFRNPILKPEAAEIVKKKGEISVSGHAYP